MCELLAMSAQKPTDMCFSLNAFLERAGDIGPHRDGWGICFYEKQACRLIRDPAPGSQCQLAGFLKNYPLKSEMVLSHIRRANRGKVCLENTHPFERELWGRQWSFMHNGQLKGIKKKKLSYYQPIGSTDSEYAFCYLLDQIRSRYAKPPADKTLARFIAQVAKKLGSMGVFNMVLADGKHIYAHCSTRLQLIERVEGKGDKKNSISVIATHPLTDDPAWQKLSKGDFIVLRSGKTYDTDGKAWSA